MSRRQTPVGLKWLLFVLFLIGIVLNVLIIIDVEWWGVLLTPGEADLQQSLPPFQEFAGSSMQASR